MFVGLFPYFIEYFDNFWCNNAPFAAGGRAALPRTPLHFRGDVRGVLGLFEAAGQLEVAPTALANKGVFGPKTADVVQFVVDECLSIPNGVWCLGMQCSFSTDQVLRGL